jgi:hypothetical protein
MTENQLVPAAQYLRMSTEHQQYSLENQSAAIQKYAELHGFEVVRTYLDEARSGLVLRQSASFLLSQTSAYLYSIRAVWMKRPDPKVVIQLAHYTRGEVTSHLCETERAFRPRC